MGYEYNFGFNVINSLMVIVCKGLSPIAGVPHFIDNYSYTEYKIKMYYFREVVSDRMRPIHHFYLEDTIL